MTQPLSTDLLFRFYFKKLGVPYNPSPAPTLTMELPDGTVSTPSLTSVRTGEYSYTLLAANVTLAGSYVATAATTDATADYFASIATWEVGTNDVVSIWTYTARTLTAFAFTVNAAITSVATGAITAAAFASGALDAVWSTVTRTITGGTATNLTNAPTNGDFTATMKASLNASTPASVTTVTGNVNGNVTGSVGSVLGSVAGSVASVVGDVGGNVVGSVGSVLGNVAGSVASVVGDVGGNVVGSVGSVLGNIGGNVAGSVANVLAFAQAALAQFFTTNTGETYDDAVDGSVVKEIASNVTASTDTSSFSGAAATQIDEIQAEVESLRGSELVTLSPTMTGGDIQVTRGMDYYAVDGFAYTFILPESGADLTGATGKLYISTNGSPLEISSYSLNPTTRAVVFQMSAAQSAKALGSVCEIDVILANTHVWKVAVGTMTVTSGLAT